MISDKAVQGGSQPSESTSDKTTPLIGPRRRGRQPVPLATHHAGIHAGIHAAYTTALARVKTFDDDTRRAYASRVRGYLAWLATADAEVVLAPDAYKGFR